MQATLNSVLPVVQSVFLKIQNNSMAPQLPPDAVVKAASVPPEAWHTQKSKVCAVALKDSLVIARIKKNKLKDKRRLTLHFDNSHYRAITISGRDIVGMWLIESIASKKVK